MNAMLTGGRVLVVGAVNVDLVVGADRLPGPGETVVGDRVDRHGGGKGANAAVAAARAGADVRYCGAVGQDDMGEVALAELRHEGVDVAGVKVRRDVPTGMALIVVNREGENQIAVGSGANASVAAADVEHAVRSAAGWADCVLVSTEISPAAVAAAVGEASRGGIRCVLNPAPVTGALLELLELGPIVTPNRSELMDLHVRLGGERSDAVEVAAEGLARITRSPVVVTLGADGVFVVREPGNAQAVPAPLVAGARDSTGAGDTFNGVLATGLARGLDVLEACVRAVAAASLSVTSAGARAGMPDGAAIENALDIQRS